MINYTQENLQRTNWIAEKGRGTYLFVLSIGISTNNLQ